MRQVHSIDTSARTSDRGHFGVLILAPDVEFEPMPFIRFMSVTSDTPLYLQYIIDTYRPDERQRDPARSKPAFSKKTDAQLRNIAGRHQTLSNGIRKSERLRQFGVGVDTDPPA